MLDLYFGYFSNEKWLPNNKSAQAKLPINKWVGERSAKSTHKAIKTRIFPRIVNRIIIDKHNAIKTVRTNGRDGPLIIGSDSNDDDVRLSFELFNVVNETIGWNCDRTCMWIIHMEKKKKKTRQQ